MNIRLLPALIALALPLPGAAMAQPPVTGSITLFGPGTLVVCTFDPPYSCHYLKLTHHTLTVSARSGKTLRPARGEWVSVATTTMGGRQAARIVTIYPGRIVRTLPNFQSGQASQVQNTLEGLRGVKSVRINKDLGEVEISFDPGRTSAGAIERQASRKGLKLVLPG